MTETIHGGPEAFLESLREELSPCASSHHISFAAVLAERRLASAGEYADWEPGLGQGASPRRIMEAVWEHACGRAIAPDRLGEFEADLSEVATLVDPDRFAAFDSYRIELARRLSATPRIGPDAVEALRRDFVT